MVVYVDLAFAINFCIDAVLLYVTAALFHANNKFYRIGIAAGIGSLYAVATLFPGLHILAASPFKLLAAFVMSALAMGSIMDVRRRVGWRNLIVRFLGFIGVSAASGGMLLAMQSLLSPTSSTLGQLMYVHHQVVWWTSLNTALWAILLPLAALVVLSLYRKANRGWHMHALYTRVRFSLDDATMLEVRALIDSGNILKDPIAHLPVAIIKIDAAKTILPPSIYDLVSEQIDPYQVLQVISAQFPEWVGRFHFIPYQGIGGKSGVMLGVKLEQAVMWDGGKARSLLPMILAFSKAADFPQADFECIIPATRASTHKGGTDTDALTTSSEIHTVHTSHSA